MALEEKILEILGGVELLEKNKKASEGKSLIDYSKNLYEMVSYAGDINPDTFNAMREARTLENSEIAREETQRAYEPRVNSKIEEKATNEFGKLVELLAGSPIALVKFIAPYSEDSKPLEGIYNAIESDDATQMKQAVITSDPTNFLNIFLVNERSKDAIKRVAQTEYANRSREYIANNFTTLKKNDESGEMEPHYDPEKAIAHINNLFDNKEKKKEVALSLARNTHEILTQRG